MPRAHVDWNRRANISGRRDQELLAVGDLAAEVVGQAAVREGDVGVLLEHHDPRVLVHAAGARRRGGAAGDAADDQIFVGAEAAERSGVALAWVIRGISLTRLFDLAYPCVDKQ